MGISIEQYRFRIGNFLPKCKKVVNNKHSSNNLLNLPKTFFSLKIEDENRDLDISAGHF